MRSDARKRGLATPDWERIARQERHRADQAEARAERVLRETADAWTQGAWSDVLLPKPTPPAVPVIAYANRVGDWLRERANQIGTERPEEVSDVQPG